MTESRQPVRKNSQADYIKTALRLPPDLHVLLHEAAGDKGRSLNNEILTRLYESFDDREEEARQWKDVAQLAKKLADMREASAERIQVSALATNLLITRLVPFLFVDEALPPDVQEIVQKSKKIIEDLQAFDADAEMAEVELIAKRSTTK